MPVTTGAPKPSVGGALLSGVAWTAAATVVGKVLSLGANLIVLWYLSAEEVGVATWALSISSIVAINGGMVITPLVQRGKSFDASESDGFWLAVLLASLGALALAIAGQVAAAFYDEPTLGPLTLVLAAGHLSHVFVIPVVARMQVQLQFQRIAWFSLFGVATVSATVLVGSISGAGAFAKVAPLFVSGVCFTLLCASLRLLRPIRMPTRAGLALLASPTVWLAARGMLEGVRGQGLHLVLGGIRDAATTGIFFSGYSLASQAVFMLSDNLSRVLFPTIVSLNDDPVRRDAALARLCRILMLIIPAACIVQAYTSPYIVALLPERWAGCTPVMFWLSLGLVTQPLALVTDSNLLAQRRNRSAAVCTGLRALASISGLAIGAQVADGFVSLAIGAALGLVTGNVGTFLWSLWNQGIAKRGVTSFVGRSLPIAGVLCAAGELGQRLLVGANPWIAIALQAAALSCVAVLGMRLLAAEDMRMLLLRLKLHRLLRLVGLPVD